MNNVEKLLKDIQSHTEKTLKDNVQERLDKSLLQYDYSLDIVCDNINKIDKKIVMKELSR